MSGQLKPQTRAILELLTAAGQDGATPMDALRECGCFRLAARVAELRAAGHNVVTTWETDTDGTRWARYVLLPPAPRPTTGIQEALAL
jgi:hypothetical protein